MYWYFEVLKKYAVFNGRARRKEFWWFILINFLIGCVLEISGVAYPESDGPAIISGLYQLATFLPMLGVYIRRFHDTGRSGWWVSIPLIPLVIAFLVFLALAYDGRFDEGLAIFYIGGFGGMFVLMLISFVFLCQDSEPGTNQYGPNPKEGDYGGMGLSSYTHYAPPSVHNGTGAIDYFRFSSALKQGQDNRVAPGCFVGPLFAAVAIYFFHSRETVLGFITLGVYIVLSAILETIWESRPQPNKANPNIVYTAYQNAVSLYNEGRYGEAIDMCNAILEQVYSPHVANLRDAITQEGTQKQQRHQREEAEYALAQEEVRKRIARQRELEKEQRRIEAEEQKQQWKEKLKRMSITELQRQSFNDKMVEEEWERRMLEKERKETQIRKTALPAPPPVIYENLERKQNKPPRPATYNKEQADTAFQEALSLYNVGRVNDAMGKCNAILKTTPHADTYLLRAMLWEHQGKPQQVVEDCTNAINIDPAMQLAYWKRAMALKHLIESSTWNRPKRRDDAVADLNKITSDNPLYTQAQSWIREMRAYF